jgi:CubicO group peptidase (beta-lactamase class C family)
MNLRHYFVAFSLLAWLLTSSQAQSSPSEKIDEYLMRLTGFGLTGAVLVAKDGKVVLEKGYGLADRKRNLPFTKDTVVDIGSNTKDLTKTAILQLAQNKKLDLQDTLPKFFDAVPADKAVITIEQLLEHTAGIGMYSGRDDERITKEEFLKRVFSAPLIAAPGKEENYSNPGYSLLAAIIEKVSGQSYDQYVQEHILKPAGMMTTGYSLPQWREGQLARNYANGEEQPSTFEYPRWPDGPTWNLRGNGGTLSTVGDMYKFHLALQGDTLLAPAFKAKLFDVNAPLMLVGGNGVHYFVYATDPAHRLVILLATTDSRVRATEVSKSIAVLARGGDFTLPPRLIKLDAAALHKMTGNFKLPGGAELNVTMQDDHLFVAGANEAGFHLLQGTARGNPEQMEKMSAQVNAMLEASAKNDHSLMHKAFAAALPYAQFKTRQENLWQQRNERLGAFKSVKILSTAPGQGGYVTTARLDFERGSDYAQFMWDGGGILRGIRPSMAAPGVSFYPQTATAFISFNLATGHSLSLHFKPQENGFSLSLQQPDVISTPALGKAAQLPDNAIGRIVAAYVKAFNAGDANVMQSFFQTNLSKISLTSRTMEERLRMHERVRGDLGSLTVSDASAASEQGLRVQMTTSTGKTVEFLFEPDSAEPQKLKTLRIELR